MENKLPTIKEIAKRLNVSISTVSRALSDHPRIGLRTKMQVQQLVKELGYEPNTKALSLKQQKSYVVGVVLPFIREEFFSQAISGIETAAIESNYTILFGQSYDDAEKEKNVVEAMRKQRVDGLLISLSKETTSTITCGPWRNTIFPWCTLTGCHHLKKPTRYSATCSRAPWRWWDG